MTFFRMIFKDWYIFFHSFVISSDFIANIFFFGILALFPGIFRPTPDVNAYRNE